MGKEYVTIIYNFEHEQDKALRRRIQDALDKANNEYTPPSLIYSSGTLEFNSTTSTPNSSTRSTVIKVYSTFTRV